MASLSLSLKNHNAILSEFPLLLVYIVVCMMRLIVYPFYVLMNFLYLEIECFLLPIVDFSWMSVFLGERFELGCI